MRVTKYQFVFCVLSLFTIVQCGYNEDLVSEFQKKITANVLRDLSPKCAKFYNLSNILNVEFLSIFFKLLDSSTKIPSGLESGNLFDIGVFDECYDLEAPLNNDIIHGKYCLGYRELHVPIPAQRHLLLGPTPRVFNNLKEGNESSVYITYLRYAYCIPSFCAAEDVQKIVSVVFPIGMNFTEDACYSKDNAPDLSGGAVATISVLSIFAFIVVISTIYEAYLCYSDKNPAHDILLAFSALNNGRKIFTSTSNPDQLLCLNGLRAVSMMWVILGHEYSLIGNLAIINSGSLGTIMTDKANMWILNAPLSVDTFFMVGGLVTMYTFLKSCDKGVKFNIILYYIHRYLRLTPVLAIVTLIHLYLLNYIGTGPFWNTVQSTLVDSCEERWWAGLLYIQNYLRPMENCVPQTWYLSVDMQLFVLSPLVLIPAKFWPKSIYPSLTALIIAGIITPFVVSYQNELPGLIVSMDTNLTTKYLELFYMQTYTRFGPYVVGMLFGVIAYKIRNNTYQFRKTQRNLLISLVVWLVALTGLVASLYGGADMLTSEYNRVGAAFFNGLDRNAWAFSLGLLIVLCVSGYGGPINTFLSLPIFQLVTKLSYTMYLVHYMVLTVRLAASKVNGYFGHFEAMHAFWGDFMLTFVISFLLCITFESPVITLEKYLLGGGGKSVKKPEVANAKKSDNEAA